MKKLLRKIKNWFWWKFLATDNEKIYWQQIVYGTSIAKLDKNGNKKFIDIKKFLYPRTKRDFRG